jgi:aspartate/methionine/tyrosine aminotransferase
MFDVLAMANTRESQGHYVARMEIGDTPGFRNTHIHDLIRQHASIPFRYSPSQGEEYLISKVIESQWPDCTKEQIVIGPANFLISAALASKTTPGDTVLLPDPGFATYKLAADFLGLKIEYYPVYRKGIAEFPNLTDFVMDLKVRPKVVIVNNPSNPLGVAMDGSKVWGGLNGLADLGIDIILDETYVNLIYDETSIAMPFFPATRLRSFSKEHCAPGLRVGYVASDKESVKTMSNLMSLTISCVPQFIQLAVADYLGSNESKVFTAKVRETMSQRLEFFKNSLPSGLLQTSPNAAFYALINIGDRGSEAAFKFLLDRNVSTCPGSKFGENSKNFVRVSFAGPENNFVMDIEMLTSALTDWDTCNPKFE